MARDPDIEYNSDGFPVDTIPRKEKNKQWIKAWGTAIETYCDGLGNGAPWYQGENNNKMALLRAYANGKQSMDTYQQMWELQMGDSGDTMTGMNIISETVTVAPKRVTMAIDHLVSRDMTPRVDPLTPEAVSAQEAWKAEELAKMYSAEYIAEYRAMAGIKTIEDPDAPKTPAELEIYMASGGYKDQVALAMETILLQELTANDWDDKVKEDIARNMVEVGYGVAFDKVLPGGKIVVESERPENVRFPYVAGGSFDSKTGTWIARIRKYTRTELVRAAGDDFSTEEYDEIFSKYFGSMTNSTFFTGGYNRDYSGDGQFSCMVLEYWFQSTDTIAYKKTKTQNGSYLDRRDPDWEPRESSKSTKVKDDYKQIYKGCLIAGSKFCFGAGKMAYSPRQSINDRETSLPGHVFVENFYLGSSASLVERIIPFIDAWHFAWFNQQNVLSKIIPPGIQGDANAMANVSEILGGKMSNKSYMKSAAQTGNLLYNSFNELMIHYNQRPVEFHAGFFPATFEPLAMVMRDMERNMDMVMGFNEATNATTPDPDMPVASQQVQGYGTDRALSGLHRAFVRGCRSLYWSLGGRIQAVIQKGEGNYDKKVGKFAALVAGSLDKIPMSSFGFDVTVGMSEREKAEMSRQIDIALSKPPEQGGMLQEDAIRIKRLPTLKLQEAALIAATRRRSAEAQARQEKLQQNELAKVEAAGKNSMDLLQAKMQAEIQKEMQIVQAKSQASMAEAQAKNDASVRAAVESAMATIKAAALSAQSRIEAARVSGELDNEGKVIAGDKAIEKQEVANKKPVSTPVGN